ncbi:MAG TPA: caspase family protein [Pyrinomonadaceae bacterium]|jgi:hypothetical protein|nr:caspase family protein [Pyrinomonadaceae bacterium]
MTKVAVLVGIDAYPNAPLSGCVNDANRMRESLASNYDGSPNFSCYSLLSSEQQVTRPLLRENLEKLFRHQGEVALLFFAGHGYISGLGGYLVTQDTRRYDEGISMTDVLSLASRSRSTEIVIMLDCCHSGAFGQVPLMTAEQAILREGLTVLCASRSDESAIESNGSGLFTSLVYEALGGGAASLTGEVTVASLYSFVERNMGPWQQRPQFKANLSRLEVLRRCDPLVELSALRLLTRYFETPDQVIPINASSPDNDIELGEQKARLSHFRSYRAAGLIKTPEHGAMAFDGSILLTSLGRYFWKVAKERRI